MIIISIFFKLYKIVENGKFGKNNNNFDTLNIFKIKCCPKNIKY